MGQRMYQVYRAPLTSKGSSEPLAIVTGIGPKYGFQFAKLVGSTVTIPTYDKAISEDKELINYISNVDKTTTPVSHSVITPDGILTAVDGDLTINLTGPIGISKEVLIIARHTYLEMESTTNQTTFLAFPNPGGPVMDKLKVGRTANTPCNMSIFIEVANTIAPVDPVTDVIVGIFKFTNENYTTGCVPYNYSWPLRYMVSEYDMNVLMQALSSHGTAIGTLGQDISALKTKTDVTNQALSSMGTNLTTADSNLAKSITDLGDTFNKSLGDLSTTVGKHSTDIGTNKNDISALKRDKLNAAVTYNISEVMWGGSRGNMGIFVTGQLIQLHIYFSIVSVNAVKRETMDIHYSLLKNSLDKYGITQSTFFHYVETQLSMFSMVASGTIGQMSSDKTTLTTFPAMFSVSKHDMASDYLTVSVDTPSSLTGGSLNVSMVTTITIPLCDALINN